MLLPLSLATGPSFLGVFASLSCFFLPFPNLFTNASVGRSTPSSARVGLREGEGEGGCACDGKRIEAGSRREARCAEFPLSLADVSEKEREREREKHRETASKRAGTKRGPKNVRKRRREGGKGEKQRKGTKRNETKRERAEESQERREREQKTKDMKGNGESVVQRERVCLCVC